MDESLVTELQVYVASGFVFQKILQHLHPKSLEKLFSGSLLCRHFVCNRYNKKVRKV